MKNDSKKREQIIEDDGNIIVSASAGAGITTIIINKIIHDITGINDHKTFAALTFTTKATKEIQTRLSKKKFHKNIVVMTNDAFVDAEIIRPFIKDAMGQEYLNDFIIKYN